MGEPKRIIWHDGHKVSFREQKRGSEFIAARRRFGFRDVCPLCKQRFTEKTTTTVVLIVSNQAGVPNRFVHGECLADTTDEYAWRMIAEDYEQSKRYADWFNVGESEV
jgi:hypothetical protein